MAAAFAKMAPSDHQDTRSETIDTVATEADADANPEELEDTYSTFTKAHAVLTVALVATAGFFSPFTAFVYFLSL